MKGNTLAIVLLVVGLVVGGGVGYFAAPKETAPGETITVTVEKAPLTGKTVRIGYISSTTTGMETAVPHVQEMMVPDYNEYAAKLGYDVDFEYLIDDATGQAAVHLEKVQGFKSMDINIYIGGGWSSQASAALSYTNDNNMLMWSSSSTSPLLAIPDDNLYRMCPDDTIQAPAISRMIQSMGVKYLIVIQRGDAWADGIWNFMAPHFEANGGVILERIRYAGEATEFANYLQSAEDKLAPAIAQYGVDKCGIDIISFEESVTMVTQAQDFPAVYSVKWFGSDGTSLTQQMIDDAPTQSSHLHIYSTLAAPAESAKFKALYEDYFALLARPYSYYQACAYDIGWVLAETILEAQSTDADDIIPLQATTCFNSFGASGWNLLNAAGDRGGSNYQIWGYGDIGSGVQNVVYGMYDATTDSVSWNTVYLGFAPTPR
ncbi:MAG: ABC transporter substrate-binding protein [Candidatus Bathyarchaeota archaeon]